MLEIYTINSGLDSPFHIFSDEVMKTIEPELKTFHFKKKQLIFREGFTPTGMFIMVSGKAKIYRISENGKEVILSIAEKNDLLGYHHLISNIEYSSSATVIEDSELRFIPKELFFRLVHDYPDFSLALMQSFTREFDKLLDKLVDVTSKHVRKRVAELLLRLLKRFGTESDNKTINITLLREDLAHLVVTNTETLVRILSEFRSEKLIDLQGKKISILNPKQLTKVSAMY